jgi:uncharacterized protein with FMN-binding domain
MRAALAALVVTAVVVVLLVSYDTRPPTRTNPQSALRTPAPRHGAAVRATPAPRPHPPGSRTAESRLFITPYTRIQVAATVYRGRLIDVRTTLLGGSDTHTNALNARAEPILREEALRAGNAEVDVVSGATTTSLTWIEAVQAAMEKARSGMP